MNERVKSNQGITLITLAITIIVMLLLGGISIRKALGDHGTIKESQGAVDDYMEAHDEEKEDFLTIRNELANNNKK